MFTLVNQYGEFDIAAATERSNTDDLRGIPKRMRDDDGRIHCNTLVAIYGDKWINPQSGGLVGPLVALAFGWSEDHLRDMRQRGAISWVGWVDGIPASNVVSVANYWRINIAYVTNARIDAGRARAKQMWGE